MDQNGHVMPGKVQPVSLRRGVFWPTDSVKDPTKYLLHMIYCIR